MIRVNLLPRWEAFDNVALSAGRGDTIRRWQVRIGERGAGWDEGWAARQASSTITTTTKAPPPPATTITIAMDQRKKERVLPPISLGTAHTWPQVEQMHEDQDTGIAAIGWVGYVDDRQLSNYVVWECCWRQGRQQQDGAANSRTVPPALVDSGWNTNAAYQ